MSASAAELHAREAEALDGRWLAGTPMDPAATPAEPLPPLPGFPFLIASTAAIIVGPTGGGRSSLLQAAMYDAAAGGSPLRLPRTARSPSPSSTPARPTSPRPPRRRDRRGAANAARRSCATWTWPSVIAHAWEHAPEWVDGVVGRYDVVGIDPLSAVASALDLDFDQRNAEFVTLLRPARRSPSPSPGRRRRASTDNLGHAIEAKSRAKGVSRQAGPAPTSPSPARSPPRRSGSS